MALTGNQKGKIRTVRARVRPRRKKSQQKSTRRTTMGTKMIFTHHIRKKVTFGSDGFSQPWSNPAPRAGLLGSKPGGSGSGFDHSIIADPVDPMDLDLDPTKRSRRK